MRLREKEIEARLRRYCDKVGVLCYKFVSPGHRGVPDRILIAPGGRVTFLELKAPGKSLRPLQKHEHEKLRKQGARVFWASDFVGARSVVDHLLSI